MFTTEGLAGLSDAWEEAQETFLITGVELVANQWKTVEQVGYHAFVDGEWRERVHALNEDGTRGALIVDRPVGVTRTGRTWTADQVSMALHGAPARQQMDYEFWLDGDKIRLGDTGASIPVTLRQINALLAMPQLPAKPGICRPQRYDDRQWTDAERAAAEAVKPISEEKRGLSMLADPFAKWPKCHKCSEKAGKYIGVKQYDVVSNDITTMHAQVKATCHHETWTHSVDIYQAWHGSEPYALFAPGYDK